MSSIVDFKVVDGLTLFYSETLLDPPTGVLAKENSVKFAKKILEVRSVP